jgi:tetratricopeptide (TPR) repeat protein
MLIFQASENGGKNRMKIIFVIILIITHCFNLWPERKAQSELNSTQTSEKIKKLIERSETLFNQDKDSTLYYSRKAIRLAKFAQKLKPDAFYNLGYHYYRMGKMDSAANYLEKSVRTSENLKDFTGLGKSLNLLGNVYWYLDAQLQAKKCFDRALQINLKIDNARATGKSYNNLGNFHSKLANYNKAISAFIKAREYYQEAAYLEGQAWLNFSMTRLYKRLEDYEQALNTIQKSLSQYKTISRKTDDSTGIMLCYAQLGDVYILEDQPEKALKFKLKALRMRKETGAQAAIADGYSGVGRCYYQMQEYARAREFMLKSLEYRKASNIESGRETNLKYLGYIAYNNNNLDTALTYLNLGLKSARSRKQRTSQSAILSKLANIHAEMGNYEQALPLIKKHESIQDSLYNLRISKRAAALELQHKLEQQEAKKIKLERENRINALKLDRSRKVRYLLTGIVIFFVFIIIFTFFLYKKQSKIKILEDLIPICANCKKIRTDEGYYDHVENYISSHSDAEFSHGLCPDCLEKLYPEYYHKNE